MGEATDDYEPSAGLWYAVGGVALFVVGWLLLLNAHEARNATLTVGLLLVGSGVYLIVVGAVARGTQLARLAQVARRRSTAPLDGLEGPPTRTT